MPEFNVLIRRRTSSRVPFLSERPLAKTILRRILEAAQWAPTAHNMQNFEIVVVNDKELLAAIGHIQMPISPVFIKENYAQLSFSVAELRKKKTGVLAANFPPFMRTPDLPGDVKMNSSLGPLVQSSSALLVVVYDPSRRAPASAGDFLGALSLGCVMENLWLAATAAGVSFHVVSSLSSESVEPEVKRLLSIPANLRVAFCIRLGYLASKPGKPLRVRRAVGDFCHANQYGNKGI